MTLKQLEYILEICKTGSINKASQNLYVSQSTLSFAVKQLEQELGYFIFRRKHSGIELTEEGKLLLLSAKLIVEEAQRCYNIPAFLGKQNNLSISGSWSSLVMSAFMDFRLSYPVEGIQDNFKETSFQQSMRDVMDHIYRLSIVSCLDSLVDHYRCQLNRYHITMELLAHRIPPVAVFSQDHYLSRFKDVRVSQLKNCLLVAYGISNGDNWLGAFGLTNGDNVLNIFDRGSMLDAVSRNYVAIVMQDPYFEQSLHGVVMRTIVDGPLSSIYLLRHQTYRLNTRENHFLDVLKERFRSVYPNN